MTIILDSRIARKPKLLEFIGDATTVIVTSSFPLDLLQHLPPSVRTLEIQNDVNPVIGGSLPDSILTIVLHTTGDLLDAMPEEKNIELLLSSLATPSVSVTHLSEQIKAVQGNRKTSVFRLSAGIDIATALAVLSEQTEVTLGVDVSLELVAALPTTLKKVRLAPGIGIDVVEKLPAHIKHIIINGGVDPFVIAHLPETVKIVQFAADVDETMKSSINAFWKDHIATRKELIDNLYSDIESYCRPYIENLAFVENLGEPLTEKLNIIIGLLKERAQKNSSALDMTKLSRIMTLEQNTDEFAEQVKIVGKIISFNLKSLLNMRRLQNLRRQFSTKILLPFLPKFTANDPKGELRAEIVLCLKKEGGDIDDSLIVSYSTKEIAEAHDHIQDEFRKVHQTATKRIARVNSLIAAPQSSFLLSYVTAILENDNSPHWGLALVKRIKQDVRLDDTGAEDVSLVMPSGVNNPTFYKFLQEDIQKAFDTLKEQVSKKIDWINKILPKVKNTISLLILPIQDDPTGKLNELLNIIKSNTSLSESNLQDVELVLRLGKEMAQLTIRVKAYAEREVDRILVNLGQKIANIDTQAALSLDSKSRRSIQLVTTHDSSFSINNLNMVLGLIINPKILYSEQSDVESVLDLLLWEEAKFTAIVAEAITIASQQIAAKQLILKQMQIQQQQAQTSIKSLNSVRQRFANMSTSDIRAFLLSYIPDKHPKRLAFIELVSQADSLLPTHPDHIKAVLDLGSPEELFPLMVQVPSSQVIQLQLAARNPTFAPQKVAAPPPQQIQELKPHVAQGTPLADHARIKTINELRAMRADSTLMGKLGDALANDASLMFAAGKFMSFIRRNSDFDANNKVDLNQVMQIEAQVFQSLVDMSRQILNSIQVNTSNTGTPPIRLHPTTAMIQ